MNSIGTVFDRIDLEKKISDLTKELNEKTNLIKLKDS